MKKGIVFFILLALFLFFGGVGASAQEKYHITVKGNWVINGVVIVDIEREATAYQLTCNQNMSGCSPLKEGRYQLVELPKNFGLYECKDVEVYPEFPATPVKDMRIGEYCLEKK